MTLTNEQIEKAFENTRFGTTDYRALIEDALWKFAGGYPAGHTISSICSELGLTTYNNGTSRLTDLGIKYLKEAALTSLLEELPEVHKTNYSAILFQSIYRDKVKSLIQTKLK